MRDPLRGDVACSEGGTAGSWESIRVESNEGVWGLNLLEGMVEG